MKKIPLLLLMSFFFGFNLFAQLNNSYFAENTSFNQNFKSSHQLLKNFSSKNLSYTSAVGLRAGMTSGFTFKHFFSDDAAIEGIAGYKWAWFGLSLTALYEKHKSEALSVPDLSWVYGVGGHMAFYDGYYYNWQNKNNVTYRDKTVTVLGIVGVFGLEYQLSEIPFTVGFDLMPYFDFIGRGDSFIDASFAFRYVF